MKTYAIGLLLSLAFTAGLILLALILRYPIVAIAKRLITKRQNKIFLSILLFLALFAVLLLPNFDTNKAVQWIIGIFGGVALLAGVFFLWNLYKDWLNK